MIGIYQNNILVTLVNAEDTDMIRLLVASGYQARKMGRCPHCGGTGWIKEQDDEMRIKTWIKTYRSISRY